MLSILTIFSKNQDVEEDSTRCHFLLSEPPIKKSECNLVLVSESRTAHGGCVLFLSAILAAKKQSPSFLSPFLSLSFHSLFFSFFLSLSQTFSSPPSFSKSLNIFLYTHISTHPPKTTDKAEL